jgi:hypothetical protein
MNLSGAQRHLLLLAAIALACSGRSDRYESHYGSPAPSAGIAGDSTSAAGSASVSGSKADGGTSVANGGSGGTSASGELGSGSAGVPDGGAAAGTAGAAGADGGTSEVAGAAGESGGIGSGGTSGGSSASGGTGGVSGGAAGGASGDAAMAGSGGAANVSCSLPSDCPLPVNRCILRTCVDGVCGETPRESGAVYLLDEPPDCHATTSCDGAGYPVVVLDQSNTPTPPNPCLTGTCNAAGVPSTQPRPARTPCIPDGGNGVMCDGAGKCVECLLSIDCPNGLSCSREHQCVSESCTDVDCGGPCPYCPLDKKCLSDRDCQSAACDAISLICVADHCADHRQDASESDVDCGGTFPCTRCKIGQHCYTQYDCENLSCDSLLHQCVADHCTDHTPDANETDLDCGGPNACARCPEFKMCKDTTDCQNGLTCKGSYCEI